MELLLAVFRSRTQTLTFADAMRRQGLYCSVVSTPSEAKVGCGVSAKFRYDDLPRAERLLQRYGNSFYGLFRVRNSGGRQRLTRIR